MKAREWALQVLNQVINEGAYANIALDKQHRKVNLEGQERSFAVELARGTLKAWGTLDWMLSFYLNRPLREIDPIIANILRMGFFQLFFLDKTPPSAACNEAVELAKKYGHGGTAKLVNGVLRTAVREPEKVIWPSPETEPIKYLARKYYHPVWVVKRWFEEFGFDETETLLIHNNGAPPLGIRVQTLKNSIEECLASLEEEGFVCVASELSPDGIEVFSHPPLGKSEVLRSDRATIQDEGAQLISHLVNPQVGEIILDVCAAPGGKSTHLAQLMNDQGKVIAQDIYEHKLDLIRDNARRLNLSSISVRLGDGTKVYEIGETYDRILADVPCSGLGTFQRRADVRWRKSEQQIKELSKLQLAILTSSSKALKSSGTLVYSTCTLNQEENEKVIEKFLEKNPEFQVIPVEEIVGHDKFGKKYLKLWPHKTNTDGFFAAVLKKKG